LEIGSAVLTSLFVLPVIILSVGFGISQLLKIVHIGDTGYIDEETEGYINGPNRLD
jgi:hypothetical protein